MNISLSTLYKRYRFQIILTFLLLSVESILLVLIPFGIGLSIDSLIKNEYSGIYYLGLILFLILIFSTSRRLYDTRVYSKIYALLCTKMIKNQKRNDENKSAIVTRTNLLKELVDFFEHDLTEAFTACVGVAGALIMILFLNYFVFFLCLFSIITIIAIYKLSEITIFEENFQLNNELENRLTIIESRNVFLIPHFKKIRNSMVKLSDIESYNYIIIQILIAALIIASIYLGVVLELSTGSIFAMVTYVLNFSFEVLTLPVIFQQFIRLQEITNRINKG